MAGWQGRILRVDLTRRKAVVQGLDASAARAFIGGRGLAIKILWDELPPGVDPLSPYNKLIFAAGPLTGLPGPNFGKLVVAAKSPLTGGYGDGNIGSWAAVSLRKAGYDALVVEGRAEKPSYIYIEDGKVEILDAGDYWGLNAWAVEEKLQKVHGRDAAVITIGPAGENLVRYATVISHKGRSGGRPGMGAVMGSKNLKAVVVKGRGEIPMADKAAYQKLAVEAVKEGSSSPSYGFWMRQGTTSTVEWAQEASVLPTYNFSEGQFDEFAKIGGNMVEKFETDLKSCPLCFMACGHWVPAESGSVEVDYENIAMLGSNLGIGELHKAAELNRIADTMGIDTISLGNVLGYVMEASERGYGEKLGFVVEWGDYEAAKQLAYDIAYRRGVGDLLAEGVRRIAERIGGEEFAIHTKGLEVSAYDCHAAPAMALAYATSPIGAHHKDAWVISWEVRTDRFGYTREKAAKVVELQRIRGGWYETFVGCRFPWVEVGLSLDWYPKLFKAATGVDATPDYFNEVGDRVYALIRAFWVREYGWWSRELDMPPAKWFKQPLTTGPLKGAHLDYDGYNKLLDYYYEIRGWDRNGVPTRETLRKLGLDYVVPQLERVVEVH
ncbi:MAG: aldehyde ferredoxin oxidoreductase family protein [Pyrobaculum sp.]|jgi:aldehyde:ferredoxin oxidoreductase